MLIALLIPLTLVAIVCMTVLLRAAIRQRAVPKPEAVVLGAIKVWETFFVRPNLHMDFDWTTGRGPLLFEFTFTNRGRRRIGVRSVVLAEADAIPGTGWSSRSAIRDKLPVMLEPGDTSPVFSMELDRLGRQPLDALLTDGKAAKAYVRTSDGKVLAFDVPMRPDLKEAMERQGLRQP